MILAVPTKTLSLSGKESAFLRSTTQTAFSTGDKLHCFVCEIVTRTTGPPRLRAHCLSTLQKSKDTIRRPIEIQKQQTQRCRTRRNRSPPCFPRKPQRQRWAEQLCAEPSSRSRRHGSPTRLGPSLSLRDRFAESMSASLRQSCAERPRT